MKLSKHIEIKCSIHQEAHFLEHQLLEFTGLKLYSEINSFDVQTDSSTCGHIHTISCGDSNKKILVLLHGYSASSILWYKMLKTLSQQFHVYCLDLPGAGLSARLTTEIKNTEEAIDYFVDNLELWRKALDIDSFYMGGHSFGGYIACQYALKYPNRVTKLMLVSPLGFTNYGPELYTNYNPNKKRSLKRKFMLYIYNRFWAEKHSPNGLSKLYPITFKYGFMYYVYSRFKMPKEVKPIFFQYHLKVISQPGASDPLIHFIVGPPKLKAIIPLENLVEEKMTMPVAVYYGELDRMDSSGAKRIFDNKKRKDFVFKIIPNSSHQISIEEPEVLSQEMFQFTN